MPTESCYTIVSARPGQLQPKQPKTHRCAAIGCPKIVPIALLMCGHHWKKVPPDLQSRIWRLYRPGQERQGVSGASDLYLAAVKEAVETVARKEGRKLIGEIAAGLGISRDDAQDLFSTALGDEPMAQVPGKPQVTPYED